MGFAASLKTNPDTRDITVVVLVSAMALITKEPFGAGSWGLLCSLICGFTATAKRRRVFLSRLECRFFPTVLGRLARFTTETLPLRRVDVSHKRGRWLKF